MSNGDSVNVAVRVRPLVKSEIDRGCQFAIEYASSGTPQIIVNRVEAFTYNYVFASTDTQEYLYNSCVKQRVKKLLEGFNVTILAYGQTGSGKTFTMGTAFGDHDEEEDIGVIPRAMRDIFESTARMGNQYTFTIKCSFIELYQEQLFDLLSGKTREDSIVEIREDKNGIVIPNITEVVVESEQDVIKQLMRGSSGRAVASTAMNETSSRSHAIFTITLVAENSENNKNTITTSKFNLVDLAGSERCSKTLATGDRFKEGVNINKGLLALGNVINALGSGQNVNFVPYRQSKLTRLLKDSLGGNSMTLMIACISPADYNVPETMSTLRYADRALRIKNQPIINVDTHAAEVNHLKEIIKNLRLELLAKDSNIVNISRTNPSDNATATNGLKSDAHNMFEDQLKERNDELVKENLVIQEKLNQALIELAEFEMKAHLEETLRETLRARIAEMAAMLKSCNIETPSNESNVINTEFNECAQQKLRELSQLIITVDEEYEAKKEELLLQKTHFPIMGPSQLNPTNYEETFVIDDYETLKTQTKKQISFNEELRDINRQLHLKEELHQRVCSNFTKMHLLGNGDEEKIDSEKRIEKLEAERKDLLEKLRTAQKSNTSAKLAEERRKRLQALEQELGQMRRKVMQQSKILKMREKEHEKIQNLSTEIKTMKEAKVKLIRAMRAESEKFRQWKLSREKEVTQLKSKDRKMQSEMCRQMMLHTKQRQVLKRKCEEALAINKRLKIALDRQKSVQNMRSQQSNGFKIEDWVDQELEVISSLIDAEFSLEQLMEDRAALTSRIDLMKKGKVDVNVIGDDSDLLTLEKELEIRNAQIIDLQQKVCRTDLDNRISMINKGIQNMEEGCTVVQEILKAMIKMRRENAQIASKQDHYVEKQKTKLKDVQAQLSEVSNSNEAFKSQIRALEITHNEHIADLQRNYEDKIALLLREPHNMPTDKERRDLVEGLFERVDYLQASVDRSRSNKKKNEPTEEEFIEVESDNDYSDFTDPEWLPEKKKANPKTKDLSRSLNSTNSVNTSENGSLNLSRNRCNCKGKCNTKRCACYKGDVLCCSVCRCKGSCENPRNTETDNSDTIGDNANKVKESKENECIQSASDTMTVVQSPNSDTPTIADLTYVQDRGRLSSLSFNTPSSKRKFFPTIEE